ncbi:hypothetical protein SAMN04489747_2420 [Auraticoccus monumenti]|uniref:Uncharacterized protein n=1 Tax=Auraticoccus monumenti TaxID=675864 RepID=A0A1G6ZWF7_9ACTN|nr:hypothetical protein SAMN04489747_2420 [Auraticoccus monumenti]
MGHGSSPRGRDDGSPVSYPHLGRPTVRAGCGAGYLDGMSDSDPEEHDKLIEQNQEREEQEQDQDSEPTMTAPDGERPTGDQTA